MPDPNPHHEWLNLTQVQVVFLIPGKCHDSTLKYAKLFHYSLPLSYFIAALSLNYR